MNPRHNGRWSSGLAAGQGGRLARHARRALASAAALAAIALIAPFGFVQAEEAAATAPLHGGAVSTTQARAFETVVKPDGIRVYFYTDELAPAMVEKAAGTAMLKLPGGRSVEVKLTAQKPADEKTGVFFCPMHPEVVQGQPGKCDPCQGMILFHQDHLFGAANLAGIEPEEIAATIRITGLRGREKEATFAPAFRTPDRKAGNGESGGAKETK